MTLKLNIELCTKTFLLGVCKLRELEEGFKIILRESNELIILVKRLNY